MIALIFVSALALADAHRRSLCCRRGAEAYAASKVWHRDRADLARKVAALSREYANQRWREAESAEDEERWRILKAAHTYEASAAAEDREADREAADAERAASLEEACHRATWRPWLDVPAGSD
jgi:hypothetical protein